MKSFVGQALAALTALSALDTVYAGVLGRYELAQPLMEENAVRAISPQARAALQDRNLALADAAIGKQDLAVEKRIVGTVSCNGFSKSGTLQLVSTSTGRAKNAAFEGVRNQEKQNQLDLGHSTTDAPAQTFTFHACSSDFMEWHKSSNDEATVWYGHLQWNQSPRHCVAAADLGESSTRVVNEMCAYSDDSSQLFQYWSLTNSAGSSDWYIDFLGEPRNDPGGDFKGKYTLGRETPNPNGQGTHFTTIKFSDDESVKPAYRLQLA